jgi:hypothetical protein
MIVIAYSSEILLPNYNTAMCQEYSLNNGLNVLNIQQNLNSTYCLHFFTEDGMFSSAMLVRTLQYTLYNNSEVQNTNT